jgi:hypothetical protein
MSITTDQGFLQRAKNQIFEFQRRRAMKARREKIEARRDNAEFELFLDSAKAEGFDINNDLHLAIIIRAWSMKKSEVLDDDDLDMIDSHEALTF